MNIKRCSFMFLAVLLVTVVMLSTVSFASLDPCDPMDIWFFSNDSGSSFPYDDMQVSTYTYATKNGPGGTGHDGLVNNVYAYGAFYTNQGGNVALFWSNSDTRTNALQASVNYEYPGMDTFVYTHHISAVRCIVCGSYEKEEDSLT